MHTSILKIKCNNIGRLEINQLVDFYKQLNCEELNTIIIEFEKLDDETFGEVDQVFLSYLILIISDFNESKFHFNFGENPVFYSRAFSLRYQLEHIRHILNLSEKQITLEGKYIDKDGKISNISLYTYNDILMILMPTI